METYRLTHRLFVYAASCANTYVFLNNKFITHKQNKNHYFKLTCQKIANMF